LVDLAQLRERLSEEPSTDVPQPHDERRQWNVQVEDALRRAVAGGE
jgi:hypothetical protein